MVRLFPTSARSRARTGAQSVAAGALRDAATRRFDLLRSPRPAEARGPALRFVLGEAANLLAPVRRQFVPPFELPRTACPQVVILLPGFASHPLRMRYMARQLERAGHVVKNWGLGWNLGPTPANFAQLEARVRQVRERYGRPVVLVGWSLGGVFAREIAQRHPQDIAKVVTMGTPFSGSPYANNGWRAYQLITGHSVEQPPIDAHPAKPPVETVALWSPRDGVIAPRSARGLPGERDREVALRCTHNGFANSPEAIRAVARELEIG